VILCFWADRQKGERRERDRGTGEPVSSASGWLDEEDVVVAAMVVEE